jgi:hypothetical protein
VKVPEGKFVAHRRRCFRTCKLSSAHSSADIHRSSRI